MNRAIWIVVVSRKVGRFVLANATGDGWFQLYVSFVCFVQLRRRASERMICPPTTTSKTHSRLLVAKTSALACEPGCKSRSLIWSQISDSNSYSRRSEAAEISIPAASGSCVIEHHDHVQTFGRSCAELKIVIDRGQFRDSSCFEAERRLKHKLEWRTTLSRANRTFYAAHFRSV